MNSKEMLEIFENKLQENTIDSLRYILNEVKIGINFGQADQVFDVERDFRTLGFNCHNCNKLLGELKILGYDVEYVVDRGIVIVSLPGVSYE
jgi:hypothetical protein